MQNDDGAVVDIAPGEVMAAGDVVELVAKIAVADMRGVERERESEKQLGKDED